MTTYTLKTNDKSDWKGLSAFYAVKASCEATFRNASPMIVDENGETVNRKELEKILMKTWKKLA